MKIIWYCSTEQTYGYSSKNEFLQKLSSVNFAASLSKMYELEGFSDHVLDRLVMEMNKRLNVYDVSFKFSPQNYS
ncbi:hypothetical protein [Ekhidna sp.]|uniref:hypothetical protein n=1 Tax=Ekhidna sp. TaxID=2608089 RepID=UPI003B50DF17